MGENLSRQIVFDCTGALTDRPNATIVCVIQRTGDKEPYAAQMTRVGDTGSYKLVLTSTEVAKSGSVRFELRMVDGEEILKAAIYTGTVEASMSGIGDTPGEPIPDALNRLETAISEVGKYADLKKEVETLQTSGASTAEVADTNAVSIHGADGVYDLSKGTIQARLNGLEAGEALKVTKTNMNISTLITSATMTLKNVTVGAHAVTYANNFPGLFTDASNPFDDTTNVFVTAASLNAPLYLFAPVITRTETLIGGVFGILNPTESSLTIENATVNIYAVNIAQKEFVTDVSGNVIFPGGAGDVIKSYVDSQDAALDAKITTAINAANAERRFNSRRRRCV